MLAGGITDEWSISMTTRQRIWFLARKKLHRYIVTGWYDWFFKRDKIYVKYPSRNRDVISLYRNKSWTFVSYIEIARHIHLRIFVPRHISNPLIKGNISPYYMLTICRVRCRIKLLKYFYKLSILVYNFNHFLYICIKSCDLTET